MASTSRRSSGDRRSCGRRFRARKQKSLEAPLVPTTCLSCCTEYWTKGILRQMIRERNLHVCILIIRMTIEDGMIKHCTKRSTGFLCLVHEDNKECPFLRRGNEAESEEHSDEPRPSTGRRFSDHVRRSVRRAIAELARGVSKRFHRYRKWASDSDISSATEANRQEHLVKTFVNRFAGALKSNVFWLHQAVDNVLTGHRNVLLDLNAEQLQDLSSRTVLELEDIICNMFCKPAPELDRPENLRCFFSSRRKNWFDNSTENGPGMAAHSSAYSGSLDRCYRSNDPCRYGTGKCVHKVQHICDGSYSWYMAPFFYHVDAPRRSGDKRSINIQDVCSLDFFNPQVVLMSGDPLKMGTNVAHGMSMNFHSSFKYISEYMNDIGFPSDPSIKAGKQIPFVVRSTDPNSGCYIFHMVYRDRLHDSARYHDLYGCLIMLRDSMARLHLKRIALPRLGHGREKLKFSKVHKMIEFVFMYSGIDVLICTRIDEPRTRKRSICKGGSTSNDEHQQW